MGFTIAKPFDGHSECPKADVVQVWDGGQKNFEGEPNSLTPGELMMIWNVIDRRGQPHRWARCHAIVEATWHDNSVSGADQAPPTTPETEVIFDERVDVSVNEAINWASRQSCPVTLYLLDGGSDLSTSTKEVQAAARILDGFGRSNGWWSSDTPAFDDLDPVRKTDFEFVVEGMLRAAARARGEGAT